MMLTSVMRMMMLRMVGDSLGCDWAIDDLALCTGEIPEVSLILTGFPIGIDNLSALGHTADL
jgi:hypothetical protein